MFDVKQIDERGEMWPLLFVADVQRSMAFYRDRLGFDVVDEAAEDVRVFWCRMNRGGWTVMLQQAEAEDGPAEGRGRGVVFYFVCRDVNAVHADLVARGVSVTEPSDAYYGMRQIELTDPDGYQLCFESPTG